MKVREEEKYMSRCIQKIRKRRGREGKEEVKNGKKI